MPFLEGYVALVDVLGFKGIWKETNPDELLAWLRELEQDLHRQREGYERSFALTHRGNLSMQVSLLSDTVAIGIGFRNSPYDRDPEDQEKQDRAGQEWRYSLSTISYLLMQLVERWALAQPGKALRGCVSAGTFAIEGSFLLGSAVDEAATYHERAEGAFIWMLPSVSKRSQFTGGNRSSFGFATWTPYPVPLKDGTSDEVFALEIAYGIPPFQADQGACLCDEVLKAFGEAADPSVARKKENTRSFLEHCRSLANQYPKRCHSEGG